MVEVVAAISAVAAILIIFMVEYLKHKRINKRKRQEINNNDN